MRKYLLIVLILLFILPVSGQDDHNEPEIRLTPFASLPMNVQGLHPVGWFPQQNAEGVFIRGRTSIDLAAIIMQARAISKDEFLGNVASSYDVEDLEPVDTFESEYLNWDIYQFTRMQDIREVVIDLAIAEDDVNERIYYVLVQVIEDEYEALHEQVFIPAITWMSEIQYYEDPEGQFRVPVPLGWNVVEKEDFVQLQNNEGNLVITMTATVSNDPISPAEEFLSTINPDFNERFDPESHILNVIEDPDRIGDLESVYIIDWVDSTRADAGGFMIQTVSRIYDGVNYITAIVGNVSAINNYDLDIALIDNGFMITALEEAQTAGEIAGVDE